MRIPNPDTRGTTAGMFAHHFSNKLSTHYMALKMNHFLSAELIEERKKQFQRAVQDTIDKNLPDYFFAGDNFDDEKEKPAPVADDFLQPVIDLCQNAINCLDAESVEKLYQSISELLEQIKEKLIPITNDFLKLVIILSQATDWSNAKSVEILYQFIDNFLSQARVFIEIDDF